jgi:hypothetical protein|tara:strand:- start:382 stop:690 length:309 start_codon:yes stop_codon:yes gene_type:complete
MRHVQRPNQLLQLLFWTKNKILKAKEPEGLLDVDRRQPKAELVYMSLDPDSYSEFRVFKISKRKYTVLVQRFKPGSTNNFPQVKNFSDYDGALDWLSNFKEN